MQAQSKYVFVNSMVTSSDQKTAELIQSEARSHAATVSRSRLTSVYNTTSALPQADTFETRSIPLHHDVRRAGKVASKERSKCHKRTVLPIYSKFRLPFYNTDSPFVPRETAPSVGTKRQGRAQAVGPASGSRSGSVCRTVTEFSTAESDLSSPYPTKLPPKILRMTFAQVSDVLLQAALETIASDEILLMWYLVANESQNINFQQCRPESQLSILVRRNYIYNLMRSRLRSETIPSNQFIYAVALAASVERKLDNAVSSEYHRRGLCNLFLIRGGIKALSEMPFPQSSMIVNVLIELGLPELYNHERRLPEAIESLKAKLRQLQTWITDLKGLGKLVDRRCRDGTEWNVVTSPHSLPDQGAPNTVQMEMNDQILPSASLLDYIKPPGAGLNETQQRAYFAVLFTISNDFFAFKDNRQASEAYLYMLMHSADTGTSEDFTLQCVVAKLPALPILLAISRYVAETYLQEKATGGSTSAEDVFQFVELAMMMSTGHRDVVLRALWSWLTSPDQANLCCLQSEQLEAMMKDIENWQSHGRTNHVEHTYPR